MSSGSDAGATEAIAFVLFGATGDLSKRMVLPAFYQLYQHGLLPARWLLIGNGRGDVSHEDFQDAVRAAVVEFGLTVEDGSWQRFAKRVRFAGGGFTDSDPGMLLDVLRDAHEQLGDDVRLIHYLALPPVAFAGITEAIGAHGLDKNARVVYEKPFGTSPENFRELDEVVHRVLEERQIFRIDHFLGKEAVEDLYALRFGNRLFQETWSREAVRAVQIDVPETLDIVDRAVFYDATGALLDMVVTHLFQLAAEITMETPASSSAEDLQSARETVIAAFRPLAEEDAVLGQFDGYRDTEGVADDSTRDTFAALRLWVDTPRWRDVPFLLRTGKQLARSEQRISLIFRDPDGPLRGALPQSANVLAITMAGSGAIKLGIALKRPGPDSTITHAAVGLALDSVEGGDPLPPYVRLISDIIAGDRSLFTRPDGLAHTWETVAPILENPPTVHPYPRGSWGPQPAEDLALPDGWLVESDPGSQ